MTTQTVAFLRQFNSKFVMDEKYAQRCDKYFVRIMSYEELLAIFELDFKLYYQEESYALSMHNDAPKKFLEADPNTKFVISFRSYGNLRKAIIQHHRETSETN